MPPWQEISVPPHVRSCDYGEDAEITRCDRQKIGIAQETLNVMVF